MKYIFENNGMLDLKALTTIGVSVKDGENPIGVFGSGASYAIAVILRHGGKIKLLNGLDEYDFTVREHEIRGKKFDFIYMNDKELNTTTRMGLNWEMWQAFREIACNTLDEGGSWYKQASMPKPEQGKVQVIVESEEFGSVFDQDHLVFLKKENPVASSQEIEIYSGYSKFLYYKGVRIKEIENPSEFTYNILADVTLTEDRTIKDEFWTNLDLAAYVFNTNYLPAIKKFLFKTGNTYEGGVYCYPRQGKVHITEEVISLVREETKAGNLVKQDIREMCNVDFISLFSENPDYELSEIQKKQVDKSSKFLVQLGFNIDKYPIRVLETLGSGVMGRALNGTIFLSKDAFNKGTKYIAETIYEEYIHMEYNVFDETRAFQDLVIEHLIHLGEQLVGEPL